MSKPTRVCGLSAPSAKLTPFGAALVAAAVALPAGGVIALIDLLI